MTAYTYLVANDYRIAMDYAMYHGLPAPTTRYVSLPEVLKGTDRPRVIVIGQAEAVPQSIVEALARHKAEVTYDNS